MRENTSPVISPGAGEIVSDIPVFSTHSSESSDLCSIKGKVSRLDNPVTKWMFAPKTFSC